MITRTHCPSCDKEVAVIVVLLGCKFFVPADIGTVYEGIRDWNVMELKGVWCYICNAELVDHIPAKDLRDLYEAAKNS